MLGEFVKAFVYFVLFQTVNLLLYKNTVVGKELLHPRLERYRLSIGFHYSFLYHVIYISKIFFCRPCESSVHKIMLHFVKFLQSEGK